MMSRLDAFTALVIFALENGGEEQVSVRRAIARMEPMIENLRRQVKFGWGPCPRCGGQSHAVICWQCKQDLPEWLRRLDTITVEGTDRRDADEQIVAWAMTKRRAA